MGDDSVNVIQMVIAKLHWAEPLVVPPAPHLLRGAIASQYPDQPIFHQHTNSGVLYRYPLVHYRREKECSFIVAFSEGAQALLQVPFLEKPLTLGQKTAHIAHVDCRMRNHELTVSPHLLRYTFRSPWLPLNQDNFARYQNMAREEQAVERDRLAVANILSALKGLGIYFDDCLYAAFFLRRSCACRYKDQKLLGFLGTLVTNADLPSDLAIGKAVSHGYGWIQRSGTVVR